MEEPQPSDPALMPTPLHQAPNPMQRKLERIEKELKGKRRKLTSPRKSSDLRGEADANTIRLVPNKGKC